MTTLPPADWYPDPAGGGQLRWFDGADWTDFYHPGTRETLPTRSGLTADDVVAVAFSKPPRGKRGYNEDDVDALLDRAERQLRNPRAALLTADDVRNAKFSKPPIGKRGYNVDEVDAFLDLVVQSLR